MNFYLSKAKREEAEILETLGKQEIYDLFQNIPESAKFKGEFSLPDSKSEPEVFTILNGLAQKNQSLSKMISFLGAGAYNHYIPAVVSEIIGRAEFYTSYTPYQPEISQGILQAIFEYQTMICELTALEISNASLYDGATALAEAVRMAFNFTGRKKILVDPYVHPNYLKVLKTYGIDFVTPKVKEKKFLYADELQKLISDELAGVVVSQPNFLGQVENPQKFKELAQIAHDKGALFIVVFNPISLGILEAPGNYGADIAVGEGQSLGNPLNFGGPYLGLIASKEKFLRFMPGRIVGETTDFKGERGFVLTLQTREQHIRRERATSNICSNQALCALSAAVYLTWLGPEGLKRVAELSFERAIYAEEKLKKLKGCQVLKEAPFFNEFVLKVGVSSEKIQKKLLRKKILAGVNLGKFYRELNNCLLLAFTENNSFEEIDFFVEELGSVL